MEYKEKKQRLVKFVKYKNMNYIIIFLPLAVIFLIWEFGAKSVYGMGAIKQISIFRKAKENIELLIRPGWEIEKFEASDTDTGNGGGYEIYIKISNKKLMEWTNNYVTVDENGKIIKEGLTESMKFYEKYHEKK